jgi:ribosomal protein S25
MMDRLAKSGLKAAALIAASKLPEENVVVDRLDMLHAFFYIEQWLRHTIYIVNNIGKSNDERLIQKILLTIQANQGVLRSEIMRRNYMSARDAEQVFLTMEQRGLVRREKKGGRGERIYTTS